MSKKKTLKAIHNGVRGGQQGWTGLIPDEEAYEQLKNLETDWPEHVKKQMTTIRIPRALFYRLLALDMYLDKLNEAEEKAALDALNLEESNGQEA